MKRASMAALLSLVVGMPVAWAAKPSSGVGLVGPDHFGFHVDTLEGEVVVLSDGATFFASVDLAGETGPDGVVDHLFELQAHQAPAEPLRLSGRGAVEFWHSGFSVVLPDEARVLSFVVGKGSTPWRTQGEVVHQLFRGKGLVERSGAGLPDLSQGAETVSRVLAADTTEPEIGTEPAGSCQLSCSIGCGRGSCSATCETGSCAKCKCIEFGDKSIPGCSCI